MDKTLVKAVRRRELAPVSHRITDVTARPASSGRNHTIALDAKSVRPRTFMLLFGVDVEIALWRRFRWSPNRTRHRHQTPVALHYINVFLRERNQNTHFGWVVRLIRSHVVGSASAYVPSCGTAGKQQNRRAGA